MHIVRLSAIAIACLLGAGCASSHMQPIGMPVVNQELAQSSKQGADAALDLYFPCLRHTLKMERQSQSAQTAREAALDICDSLAREYAKQMAHYSAALRIGHPNELEYATELSEKLYTDLVQSGRKFAINEEAQ